MRNTSSESISAWHARAMHLVFFEMVKLLNAEVGGMSGVDEGSQRAAHSLQMCEKPWWQELLSNSRLESFADGFGAHELLRIAETHVQTSVTSHVQPERGDARTRERGPKVRRTRERELCINLYKY